jgi:hypothetical protein
MIPLPTIDPLDSLTIPVACPVPWDTMRGDHRTRFCDKCSQNVHDVSELTRDEALQLVTGGEKLPCVRLFRRPDGRVITSDCMTKRERAWKWLLRYSAPAAALFAVVFLGCERLTTTAGIPCRNEPDPSMTHEEEHFAQSIAADEKAKATAQDESAPRP